MSGFSSAAFVGLRLYSMRSILDVVAPDGDRLPTIRLHEGLGPCIARRKGTLRDRWERHRQDGNTRIKQDGNSADRRRILTLDVSD
jgi:hypothetical protein